MTLVVDQFANFAISTIAGGAGGIGTAFNTADTVLFLNAGDGAKFPTTGPFRSLIGSPAPASAHELILCTGRSVDTLLGITRGIEGVGATASWPVGTTIQEGATAGTFQNIWNRMVGATQTGVFNVRDYGAVGDGVTDDTAAIQSAVTAAQNNVGGGMVYLTGGTFRQSSTITISSDNVGIMGDGWSSQLLATSNLSGQFMIQVNASGSFRYGLVFKDFYLNGNNVPGVGGLNLVSTYHALVDHVRVRYCLGTSVWFNGVPGKFGAYNYMRHCTVTDGSSGVGVMTTNSEWLILQGNSFVSYQATGAYGVQLNNLNCVVNACQFDNIDTALYMSYSSRATVTNCQFDRAGTRFINLRGNQSSTISNCSFNTRTGVGATECINVNDPNNQSNTISGCTVEPGTTWTNFVSENGNVGGPGNVYSGNALGGLRMNLVNGVAYGNSGYNPLTQLPAPNTPTLTNSTASGAVPAGTYNVKISYTNPFGETTPSAAAAITTTGATNTLTITSPVQQGNAYGWYAYVTQAGGATYYRQQPAGAPSQLGNTYVLTTTPTTGGATPLGANGTAGFAQPTLPLSGVSYVNGFGVPVTVYVSGGSVTSVLISGVSTAQTLGMFSLGAYQSITLNYNASPSWVWFGL